MTTTRKYWLAALVAVGLLATACGDDSDTATEAPSPAATAEAPPTTEAAAPTTTEPMDEAAPVLIEGVPEGMPTEYGGPILAVDPDNPPSSAGQGGFFVTVTGPVTAEDGTVADVTFSVYDFRAEGGAVECGGETREGAFTAENTSVTTGVISIAGWGAADLRIESTVHAFDNQLGAPFCDEQTGTWTGFDGELQGKTGTFHRLMIDGQEAITLN